ncbi:MAG: phosphopentomutase [Bacteroidetes bacterium]|nr:phosphopentomutase [Bacteroidota bacterium]
MGNFFLIILDGVGCGHQEDAEFYGDVGSNTLGHVSALTKVNLPNMQKLGLGNIIPLDSIPPVFNPIASYGKMREVSKGKDSTTGHWEIAGVTLKKPFPTYPNGFPQDVLDSFMQATGTHTVYANKPYSGTVVVDTFGDEHVRTGQPIVYTSADSVFQIAAHTDVVPIEKLYEWCDMARNKVMIGKHLVGRVIARPFTGVSGAFKRVSEQRKDYSAIPPEIALPNYLKSNKIQTYSIGKIIDLFAGIGFNQFHKTRNNAEGIAQLLTAMSAVEHSFVFINLVDFDQNFGHRLDPIGFAGALEEFDRAVPQILSKLRKEDVLIITADHGNDPVGTNTDHAREFVPLLVISERENLKKELGTRNTFADVAASACAFFSLENSYKAISFI